MGGIVLGGLIGGPVITLMVRRHALVSTRPQDHVAPADEASGMLMTEAQREFSALTSIVAILVAMWIGAWVSQWISATGVNLPASAGAMLGGALTPTGRPAGVER